MASLSGSVSLFASAFALFLLCSSLKVEFSRAVFPAIASAAICEIKVLRLGGHLASTIRDELSCETLSENTPDGVEKVFGYLVSTHSFVSKKVFCPEMLCAVLCDATPLFVLAKTPGVGLGSNRVPKRPKSLKPGLKIEECAALIPIIKDADALNWRTFFMTVFAIDRRKKQVELVPIES
jgi:hypothetical protein